jgi:hypothetical protein
VSRFQNFVLAVNSVNSNVWAFVAMGIGVVLSVHGLAVGESIIMGAFALWKSDSFKGATP